MGNSKLIQLKPHLDKNKNISFGGKIEEEMIQKFNAFDILCEVCKKLGDMYNPRCLALINYWELD